jgi:acyl-CoA synthetase (AMP-forming)/AMP-acid ligase II
MKIHEYQAKEILRSYGVPTPRGEVAFTPDEAKEAAERLGGRVVVKAQIHAGGRGKGGGVKLGDGPAEARKLAEQILGMTLMTHQTGPEGRLVKRVLVEETLPIAREIYLGMTLDRATGKSIFMASSEGGMEIEVVAAKDPALILKETVEPAVGLAGYQARRLAFKMGITGDAFNAAVKAMQALAKAYTATDATMLEINPFVITDDGRAVEPGSGETGRVAVGGWQPVGYYKDEAKTAATFITFEGKRYSVPGDYATVEPDGSLTLLGRGSVCINTGGEKVYPEEVEEVLKTHEAVADAVAVGIPDDKFGEAITAVVELVPGASFDEGDIVVHVKDKLAAYKAPKRVLAIDTIGRAPNGKVDYKRLTGWAADELGVAL